MCLLAVAWKVRADLPFILIGNRDEFHARPAAPVHWWSEPGDILGGRDLEAGGSWLALNRAGRLAVVTNVRESAAPTAGELSRGELVIDALTHSGSVRDFAAALDEKKHRYGGFNLLVRNGEGLHCLSNRGEDRFDLPPGVYGLSNHLLDTPWPKVQRVKEGLRRLVDDDRIGPEELFALLEDRTPAADDELPSTGVPLEWERALSPVFIAGPEYGTRASSVAMTSSDGHLELIERRFGPDGRPMGETRIERTDVQ